MAQKFEVPFDEACCVSQLLEMHLAIGRDELFKLFAEVIYKKVHKIIYRQMMFGTWCNGCFSDKPNEANHDCQKSYACAFDCHDEDVLQQINNKNKYMSQFAQRASVIHVTRRALAEMICTSFDQLFKSSKQYVVQALDKEYKGKILSIGFGDDVDEIDSGFGDDDED